MRQLSIDLNNLAKVLYSGRDKSHGIAHVTKVRDNALSICNKIGINDVNLIIKIETAALFHDLWDHKYVLKNSKQCDEIRKKLSSELKKIYFSEHDIKDIEIIIDNISLSREIKFRNKNQILDLKHLQLMRDIVSDADKLEMLGINGIDRIIEFQLHKYPNTCDEELNNVIKKVYNSKLKNLIDESYIKTKAGKEMAMPLMEEMNDYIETNIKF